VNGAYVVILGGGQQMMQGWETPSIFSIHITLVQRGTARKRGADPDVVDRALREVPDVSPLDALAASREAVERLTGYRWFIMQDAREKGASWGEIGDALGMGEKEVQDWYRDKITQREELVPRLP
jgi:hypothetical protein